MKKRIKTSPGLYYSKNLGQASNPTERLLLQKIGVTGLGGGGGEGDGGGGDGDWMGGEGDGGGGEGGGSGSGGRAGTGAHDVELHTATSSKPHPVAQQVPARSSAAEHSRLPCAPHSCVASYSVADAVFTPLTSGLTNVPPLVQIEPKH